MKKTTKKVLSLILALVLSLAFSVPAFAAGTISPSTDTLTYYLSTKEQDYPAYIYVDLAVGDKDFTIKRSDIKVSKGTTGAKLITLAKTYSTSKYTNEHRWESSSWETYESDERYCSYFADLLVTAPGTAKITYKIGSKSYARTIKILGYVNPIESITLTGVNSDKSFASLTKNNSDASKKMNIKATTKNAKLKVTSKSGWVISSLNISDEETSFSRRVSGIGLTSASIAYGTLNKNHRYSIGVSLTNTKNGAYQYITYRVGSGWNY